MRFEVVTLFPEFFDSPLGVGLLGKAREAGGIELGFVDPRSLAEDRHRTVDDTPYGGGAGMVMMPQLVVPAIEIAKQRAPAGTKVLLMSPQGRPATDADCRRWATLPGLILVAGRYEGFDERIRAYVDEEVAVGDFVVTGGEYAALSIIDAVSRLLPGTVGNEASIGSDSFASGLLEHPQYTRPPEFRGTSVPEVLLSGHHERIEAWRMARSLERTRLRRPDLLEEVALSDAQTDALRTSASVNPRVELIVSLRHERVAHKYLELSAAYGVSRTSFILAEDRRGGLEAWLEEERSKAARFPPPPRKPTRRQRAAHQRRIDALEAWQRSLEEVELFASSDAALEAARSRHAEAWTVAPEPTPSAEPPSIGPRALRRRASEARASLILCLGVEASVDLRLVGLRRGSPYQGIRGISEAAILLDRLLGEG